MPESNSESVQENLCKDSVFEKVFEANQQTLIHFLYYKFGDLEKAKNFAQDSFIKLWNNCKKIAVAQAKAFLYTTAKRLFLDDIAHEKVKLKFVDRTKSLDRDTMSADEEVRTEEFKEVLETAISNLNEKQRMVFLMSRIDKMKYAEIATAMEISVKTVEKHMSQSLIKIREALQEFGTFRV